MGVSKSIGVGLVAGVTAAILLLVVTMLFPLIAGIFQSWRSGGGGIAGFSFSIELTILVAVVGFFVGFATALWWPAPH